MSEGTGPTVPLVGYSEAWTAYVDHVHPRDGETPPCPICVSAEGPGKGCDEGQRLYDAYRLARIGKPITAG
jgi:hypothetical protein